MITLSSFRRRLSGAAGSTVDVSLASGAIRWLDAQQHAGENIGRTETRVLFVELREPRVGPAANPANLGPVAS
jgi:hypothetical protein